MTTRLTLFTATLVQDSALSVSGLQRESPSDHPFSVVNGTPTLVGRGLKGAAVAMAKRFFDPLPRAISEDASNKQAFRRSAWEFADAIPVDTCITRLRAGVGISHKTGARADGILYDREVVAAGTTWQLNFRVDWSFLAGEHEGSEVEGILGYVLHEHWAHGRCWLGGGVARGLGWCHIENLRAYRLDEAAYDTWVTSGRKTLPGALNEIPTVAPTRSWSFRTRQINLTFGEYHPESTEPSEPAWGLDMLAVGTHDSENTVQNTGDGIWATPAWISEPSSISPDFITNRAIAMEGQRPLLPGSSVRGPLRHAFSRAERSQGQEVLDPHLGQDEVPSEDPGAEAFGSVSTSSRILIRDGRAEDHWYAARLHMHAEDEFSAGSYGSSKRDAVRVLKGTFPIQIVIEGPTAEALDPLMTLIDRQVALGELGHLPVGGHKTRGAGWGRWNARPWQRNDVCKKRDWTPTPLLPEATPTAPQADSPATLAYPSIPDTTNAWVRVRHDTLPSKKMTLKDALNAAKCAFPGRVPVAWWCDPTNDLALQSPPKTFGAQWPSVQSFFVDEVAFYFENALWRAAHTAQGVKSAIFEELATSTSDTRSVQVLHTPAHLHAASRFAAAATGRGTVLLREWHDDSGMLGFTVSSYQEES